MSFLKGRSSSPPTNSTWWYNPSLDQLLNISNSELEAVKQWLDQNESFRKQQAAQRINGNATNNTTTNQTPLPPTPDKNSLEVSNNLNSPRKTNSGSNLTIPQIHHCFLNAKNSSTGHPPTSLVIDLLYELELQFIKKFNVNSKGVSSLFKQYNEFIPIDENTAMLHWSLCSIAKIKGKHLERFESVFQVNDAIAFKKMFSVYEHLFGKGADQRHSIATKLSATIKDKPEQKWIVINYYYDILTHFYVFIELMYHILRVKKPTSINNSVTSPSKDGGSGASAGNGSKVTKNLKQYRISIENQMNPKNFSTHYLRIDESKDHTLVIDHNAAINIYNAQNKKQHIVKQVNEITLRNRLYDDSKDLSNYLLLIGEDIDLYFHSTFIPIKDILRLHEVLLESKSIKHDQCQYCNLSTHTTIICSYCKDKICQPCQRKDQCVKCYFLNHSIPVKVQIHDGNNKNKGSISTITLNSSRYIDFTTHVFQTFKIDKGMKIECTLHGYSTVLINNDHNLHLALRSSSLSSNSGGELANTCKLVKVRVTDPPIKGLKLKFSDLKELEAIGEGGCASVVAVEAPTIDELKDTPLVLKKFKIPYSGDDFGVRNINKTIDKSVYKFKREASFLSQVDSDYIIKMFAFVEGDTGANEFGILLERAPLGSLSNKYKDWDICNALIVVHEKGFIHQDLKPDNVLMFSESVDAPIRCKLSDFGISTKQKKMHNLGHTGVSRTNGYTAPEHGAHGNYNELVDIFSFGVLMFEVITGHYFLDYFGNPNYYWSEIDMYTSIKLLNEKMTNNNPNMRPQSMSEVKYSLEQILIECRSSKWELKDYSNIKSRK